MAIDIIGLLLSKNHTKNSLIGNGAIRGNPGLSAYEIALKNGFVGTEREWLATIKGEKGDTGSVGPKGDKGDTGERGPAGNGADITIDNEIVENSENAVSGMAVKKYIDSMLPQGTPPIVSMGNNFKRYAVIAVYGQSNAVGYDESDLTPFDVPVNPERILQFSYNENTIKELDYCADTFQNMRTAVPIGNTGTDKRAPARTFAGTKGIHLPLANLIASVIPDDMGVIVVPAAYGGQTINAFKQGGDYYTRLLEGIRRSMLYGDEPEKNIFLGIVWCQGEFNTNSGGTPASTYMNDFKAIVSAVASDLSGYAAKTPLGYLNEKIWYFYEWPRYWRNLTTGPQILAGLREFLGENYVDIPESTPTNITKRTTSGDPATHYGQNAFRTHIAPRVFSRMCRNGAFLCNLHDNDTITAEVDNTEVLSAISTLTSRVETLQKALNDYGIDTPEIITPQWRDVTPSDWIKSFGDDAALNGNTYTANNKTTGYILPQEAKGLRFKITSTTGTNAGSYLGYLILSASTADSGNVRGLDIDFTSNATIVNWIKCHVKYNEFDGQHGMSYDEFYRMFRVHEVLITVTLEDDGRLKVINGNGESAYLTPITTDNQRVRFGLGSLANFSAGLKFTDIQILM